MPGLQQEINLKPNRKGFEFLESDTEIYNALIDAYVEYPHIIGRFNIQLMNQNYMDTEKQDVNNLYVVRMDSTLSEAGFNFDVYNTKIQIVLYISQYDTERGLAFLKTTIRAIKQVLSYEPFYAYTTLDKISPEYSAPGRLTGAVLELTCREVDDLIIRDDSQLCVGLKLKAHIQETQDFEYLFPPTNCPEKLPVEKMWRDDNDFAGG